MDRNDRDKQTLSKYYHELSLILNKVDKILSLLSCGVTSSDINLYQNLLTMNTDQLQTLKDEVDNIEDLHETERKKFYHLCLVYIYTIEETKAKMKLKDDYIFKRYDIQWPVNMFDRKSCYFI